MDTKKYWSRRAPIVLVPLLAVVPIAAAVVRGSIDAYALAEALAILILASCLYLSARREVARIEGGALRFSSGTGLAEEDRIELVAITSVERPKPWYMVIRYGEGKSLGVEAEKSVLNALAKDLAIFIGKKEGAPSSGKEPEATS